MTDRPAARAKEAAQEKEENQHRGDLAAWFSR
jgi:hypothetical protein